VLDQDVQGRAGAVEGGADGGCDARQHQRRVGDRRQRDEHRSPREAVVESFRHGDRQPRLADATGAGQGDQPDPGGLQQPRDVDDVLLASDQRRRRHRQRPRDRPVRDLRRRHPRGVDDVARGREPLAEEQREVVADQSRELPRGAERTVGVGPLRLELGDHGRQPGFPLGRRVLDVQQPGDRTGEPELVLEARDVHAGSDPAVPLPVQTDEDVGLGEVGPVQLARRVRSGAELEQHRGEPECRDGPGDRRTLRGELRQRGAHEDAQTLVRRPDRDRALLVHRHVSSSRRSA
jgi:hypothetical protein